MPQERFTYRTRSGRAPVYITLKGLLNKNCASKSRHVAHTSALLFQQSAHACLRFLWNKFHLMNLLSHNVPHFPLLDIVSFNIVRFLRLLYFEWSPPWHFKIYIWTYSTYSRKFVYIYFDVPSSKYIMASYLTYVEALYLAVYVEYIVTFYRINILTTIWHIFWHSMCSICILSDILSGFTSGILFGILSDIFLALHLSGGWGPAVPTALGRSPVEVQRCPLGSGSGSWGPAVPTAIRSWRGGEEEKRRTVQRAVKSNNPHVAGEEKINSSNLSNMYPLLLKIFDNVYFNMFRSARISVAASVDTDTCFALTGACKHRTKAKRQCSPKESRRKETRTQYTRKCMTVYDEWWWWWPCWRGCTRGGVRSHPEVFTRNFVYARKRLLTEICAHTRV